MALKLMGKKRGMMQRFDERGDVVVCTVICVEPNVITQVKSEECDGYNALQLGCSKIMTKDPRTVEKRMSKQLLGHFTKNDIEPRRYLGESRVDNISDYLVGQTIGVAVFEGIAYVDVCGVSKGKGYQGVMKRYNFSGGPASHGSGFKRRGGSTGMRSTPGRGLPGQKKAGQMGNNRITVQNLRVIAIDEGRDLIIIKGGIPGPKGSLVSIAPATKKK